MGFVFTALFSYYLLSTANSVTTVNIFASLNSVATKNSVDSFFLTEQKTRPLTVTCISKKITRKNAYFDFYFPSIKIPLKCGFMKAYLSV